MPARAQLTNPLSHSPPSLHCPQFLVTITYKDLTPGGEGGTQERADADTVVSEDSDAVFSLRVCAGRRIAD